jgi:hypothetical protein
MGICLSSLLVPIFWDSIWEVRQRISVCPSILIQPTAVANAAEHRGEEELEASSVRPLKHLQMLFKFQDTIIKSSQQGFWESRKKEN